jgi:hypothetical protein
MSDHPADMPEKDFAEVEFDRVFNQKVARARLGDYVAAVEAAICIEADQGRLQLANSGDLYEELLSIAFRSTNAEFLVCVGDELIGGRFLKKDLKKGHEFYQRASINSDFMGDYALGKFWAPRKPELAEKFFRKAKKSGHLPSLILYHGLIARRVPVVGGGVRLILDSINFFRLWRAIKSGAVGIVLWRYKDLLQGKQLTDYKGLEEDRLKPFESIKKFVAGMANGARQTRPIA